MQVVLDTIVWGFNACAWLSIFWRILREAQLSGAFLGMATAGRLLWITVLVAASGTTAYAAQVK